MKVTKKERKVASGMNYATALNNISGPSNPRFAGAEGHTMRDGKVVPPFAKISKGVPYVNEANFKA